MEDNKARESVSISIIQFVADRAAVERKLTESENAKLVSENAALKELIFARFNSEKEAANLAYMELQRRLDVLNHSHEQMVQEKAHFLPRENFEQFFRDFGPWRDAVNGFQSNLTGRIAGIAAVVGLVLLLVLHFWK
jgi:hypothetical protein